jgi:hypothetical protein
MLDSVACTVEALSVVCLTYSLQRITATTPLKSRQETLVSDSSTFRWGVLYKLGLRVSGQESPYRVHELCFHRSDPSVGSYCGCFVHILFLTGLLINI